MGFKKPTKKKKKKQKSAADKEWSFEGGQKIEDSGVERNQPVMEGGRMRRQTQDRDERLRRGREKIAMRKEKDSFRARMSKKVLFSDLDGNAPKKDTRPKKKARQEPPVSTNPLPIFERLQAMIASSRGEDFGERSASESDQSEHGELSDEDDTGSVSDESETETTSAVDANDPEELTEVNLAGYFDWFFSSEDEAQLDDSAKSVRKLGVCFDSRRNPDGVMGGWLHPSVTLPHINRVGDIPGLHKLWSGRATEPLDRGVGHVLSYLSSYADAFLEVETRKQDSSAVYESELSASLWHIATHVVRSRAEVVKNDQKIKKASAKAAKSLPSKPSRKSTRGSKAKEALPEEDHECGDEEDADDADSACSKQDSGYTRARVLVLTPFRSSALHIIQELIEIVDGGSGATVVTGSEKLEMEYGMTEADADQGRLENKGKPADWHDTFVDNIDDDFKMGIQINPGQGRSTGTEAGKAPLVRLYSDFLMADIIVASPLGLRLALEKAADGAEGKAAADCLSSLEVILISQADVMLMQNWDHMEYVLRMCNNVPKADHDTDFSRIRPYFLDGKSAEHRQIIMMSPFQDPSLHAVMRESAKSRAGSVRAKRNRGDGCLSGVVSRVKQIFSVVPVTSLSSEDDDRFQYFCESVLTKVLRLKQSHTLIVTPSYLSFVRVRNELIKREANAAYVSEYSRESEISRGRSQFFHGIRDIMLYSGRAHFFRRFRMRGALHLIFYSLPEYAHFYPEIVNNLGEGGAHGTVTSCLVLCTKYEKMALERIVGSKRCAHMLTSGKTTFMFI